MSWFVSDEQIAVELEACRCPGEPHSSDTVWLRPALSAEGGMAALLAMAQGGGEEDVQVRMGRIFIEHGVTGWTFVDEDSKPIPVSREMLRRLSWEAILPIANTAANLYAEELTRPLVASRSASSPSGRTARSTSRKRKSSPALPKP